jgi:hypothetical protein
MGNAPSLGMVSQQSHDVQRISSGICIIASLNVAVIQRLARRGRNARGYTFPISEGTIMPAGNMKIAGGAMHQLAKRQLLR